MEGKLSEYYSNIKKMKLVLSLIFSILFIPFVVGIILVLFNIEAGIYMMLSSISLLLILFCSIFSKIPFFSSIGFILSMILTAIFEHEDSLVIIFGILGFVSVITMIVSIVFNVVKITKRKSLENKASSEQHV
jgi:hypothetical protein